MSFGMSCDKNAVDRANSAPPAWLVYGNTLMCLLSLGQLNVNVDWQLRYAPVIERDGARNEANKNYLHCV